MTRSEYKQLERIAGHRDPLAGLIAFLKAKAPKRGVSAFTKARQLLKKETRAELVNRVRAACVERAGMQCECGCGLLFWGAPDFTPEWDEFYGRRNVSVATAWMLTRACHRLKTENSPSREHWDARFKAHCEKHNYPFKPRLCK